jgi:WD40 repeat protein
MKMKSMPNKNNTDPVLSIGKDDDRAMNTRDTIRVYSLCSLSLSQEMKIMNPSNTIRRMMIASGGSDGNIRLWNIQKSHHDCVYILQGHSNYVTALIQLSSGYLASASHDTTIKIWDLTNLLRDQEQYISDRCILTINAHTGPIFRLCLLSDGRLASSSSDETVKIWNLENGKAEMICPDHEDCVFSVTEWKKNYLISGTDSNDSILRIWKLSSSSSTGERGECVATIPIVNCKGINFLLSLQDHRLAVADGDKNIRIWEFLPDSSSSSSSLFKGQGNDDDEEGDNVEEDEEVDSFPYQINQKNIMILKGHYWEVTYLAELKTNTMMSSSYDYHGLVSSSVDHMIRIWNLRNGHCDRILQGRQSFISGILLIPPQQPLPQQSQDDGEDDTHPRSIVKVVIVVVIVPFFLIRLFSRVLLIVSFIFGLLINYSKYRRNILLCVFVSCYTNIIELSINYLIIYGIIPYFLL